MDSTLKFSTAPECLIVFTRYPEAGKSKTRLIPALGSQGAANLQRQMTQKAIAQARELQTRHQILLEVHFHGGSGPLMQDWLGNDLVYHPQVEGDLGVKMASAFQQAFSQKKSGVVIIGSDCPDLDTDLLLQSFRSLRQHDLVLGPATDGGYYLIGLSRFIPEIFNGISWSTAAVLRQTVEVAKSMELAIAYLPTLTDIDRPEDLDRL
jgi:rSAM/selenodomain-associated transferase 1